MSLWCLQHKCFCLLGDCLSVYLGDVGHVQKKGRKAGAEALLRLVLKPSHPLRGSQGFLLSRTTFTEALLHARIAEAWGVLSLGMSWSLDTPFTEPSPFQKPANNVSWLRPHNRLRMTRGCKRKPIDAGFQLLPSPNKQCNLSGHQLTSL